MNWSRTSLALMIGGILILGSAAAFWFIPQKTDSSEADSTLDAQATTTWTQGVLTDYQAFGFTADELVLDRDADGLPDAVENYFYGSDPNAWSTIGEGIPDGWLADYGYDPTVQGTASKPAATPDSVDLPEAYEGQWDHDWTLKDVYEWGRPAQWDEADDGAWRNNIDPRAVSYADGGIPYAWFHLQGFDPDEAGESIESIKIGADELTVRENYDHNTDPHAVDTDADGLTDGSEIRQHGTAPDRFSTSGTGIADGWLIFYSLDALDPLVGGQETTGKGMTVLETWQYNVEEFGLESTIKGQGLSPVKVSTLQTGIPDGWIVEHGFDPLDAALPDSVLQQASEHPDIARNLTTTPPGEQPLGDLELTLRQHYEHGRPDDWVEQTDGVWWGSLDPRTGDKDGDMVPDVLEIRGWYIQVTTGPGPDAEPRWRFVSSNPLRNDTDGDDLLDGEEYFGLATTTDKQVRFPPSDPRNSDTAFSGLTDRAKVLDLGLWRAIENAEEDSLGFPTVPEALESNLPVHVPWLDVSRSDTAGSYLMDGDEFAHWDEYVQDAQDVAYTDLFAGTSCDAGWGWADDTDTSTLGPLGDADGDGVPNIVDSDADGDGLPNGLEVQPGLYEFAEFHQDGQPPRTVTDPANDDTDCDGLPDGWEARHAMKATDTNGWTLDPARADTDGDGTPDDEENLDEDIVIWYSYRGSQVDKNDFEFTNELEYDAGTDPNIKDQNNDGVSEGWAYFWGQEYPFNVIPGGLAGDVIPSDDQLASSSADIAKGVTALFTGLVDENGDRTGKYAGELEYRRIAELGDGEDPESTLVNDPQHQGGRWETPADPADIPGTDENPGSIDRKRAAVTVFVIDGSYRHTYHHDAGLGLNPYLDDTDDDGMPDDWEALFGTCDALNPVESDSADLSVDGSLTNGFIHDFAAGSLRHGLSPCLPDTDLDGNSDSGETRTPGLDPLNPFSSASGSGDDIDHDGEDGDDELSLGTDPVLADTDGDGALDGLSRVLQSPGDDALIDQWRSLGIAHNLGEDPDGNPQYEFRGEKAFTNFLSNDPQTSVPGIPDGWLIYYGKSSPSPAEHATLQQAYECNRPAWWDEDRMGVWWWGASPGLRPCTADMDLDGLDDRNGEDPIPAASQNASSHSHLRDKAINTSVGLQDRTIAAQGWGDCAGNPSACWTEWGADGDPAQAQAEVEIVIHQETPLPATLAKGAEFDVTGRLCTPDPTDGSCPGIPNRTIILQINNTDAVDHALGAGFTDPDGDFAFTACICLTRNATIPTTGMVLHSQDQAGKVEWTVDTADIQVDRSHDLVLRAYATSAAINDTGHPHFIDQEISGTTYHATSRNTTVPQTVMVTSPTNLTINAPPTVSWSEGRSIPVGFRLTDATGDPVPGQTVNVSIVDGTTAPSATTDSSGAGTAFIPAANIDGTVQVHATFAGNDTLEGSESGTKQTLLQAPLSIEIDVQEEKVWSGDPITVDVTAISRGQPAQGVQVGIAFGPAEEVVSTDETGTAQATGLTANGLVSGTYQVQGKVTSSDQWQGATASDSIDVLSGSDLTFELPATAAYSSTIPVTGRLALPDGTGIADRTVTLHTGGSAAIATFTTTDDGTFSGEVNLPSTLQPGLVEAQVRFEGDALVDGAESSQNIRIIIPTTLSTENIEAGRGTSITFEGVLETADGTALRGEPIRAHLEGDQIGRDVTDPQGHYAIPWTVPDNMTYGFHEVRITYPGSMDGTYEADQAVARLLVTSSANLTVQPLGNISRGAHELTGTLHATTGEPIGGGAMSATIDGVVIGQATTRDGGAFNITLSAGDAMAPGPFKVYVRFAGTEAHAKEWTTTTGTLTVQPQLVPHLPKESGRGNNITASATLVDDIGSPVQDAKVSFRFLDHNTEAITNDRGIAVATVAIPANATLGDQTITARFNGSPGHLPAQATATTAIKEGASLQFLGLDGASIDPSKPFEVEFRLVDLHGNPVKEKVVSIRMDGDTQSVLVETDDDGYGQVFLSVPPDSTGRIIAKFAGDTKYGSVGQLSESVPRSTQSAQAVHGTQVGSEDSVLVPVMMAIGLLLGVVGASVWVWSRIRVKDPVLDALTNARDHIRRGDGWASAIQAAYHRLTQQTSYHGHQEDPAHSVRDFMRSLAKTAPIPHDAAIGLTRLFEQATYEGSEADSDQAHEAERSLDRIIASIQDHLGLGSGGRSGQ